MTARRMQGAVCRLSARLLRWLDSVARFVETWPGIAAMYAVVAVLAWQRFAMLAGGAP